MSVDKGTCEVRFYGRGGNDDAGKYLLASLKRTHGDLCGIL
ncbi:MAG TPA: hypothetical protein VMW32_02360 [Bacteroidales bacterium]|nr:hypothetical protein [Bacteroidales bacterium]